MLSSRAIVFLYLFVSVLWITLSDRVATVLFPDPDALATAETLKGLAFVTVTGVLLGALLHAHDAQRMRQGVESISRERRYRLLTEHARDIIFRMSLAPALATEYLSPAVDSVLGYPASSFDDDPDLFRRLLHPDDLPAIDPGTGAWHTDDPVVVRLRHADGHWVWLEHRGTPVLDAAGRPIAVEGVARDVTEQHSVELALVRINRVQRTLSAANQALVRASEEMDLLERICRAAVEEGGFRFAWVGYVEDDVSGRIRPVARAGHEAGYLEGITVSWHDVPEGRGPTGTAFRENRTVVVRAIADDPAMLPWRDRALERGFASSAAFPIRVDGIVDGVLTIYAGEVETFGTDEVALLEEVAADLGYGVAALRTKAGVAGAESARRRLATAIEQSPESVLITDPAGAIEYVNPAFERVTGYTAAEIVGRNPRLLQSGRQTRAFYEAMWQTLTDGRPWVGDFVNRRKDGTLFTEEAVISPVHDRAGTIVGYVAVKRDVTLERAAQLHEQTMARERAQIADALAALHPQATLEETADAFCRQIALLPEANVAVLLAFDLDQRTTALGGATAAGRGLEHHRLSADRAGHLHARAIEGPWVESWSAGRDRPLNRAFREIGISALAYAPIRVDRQVVGLLEVGSAGPDAPERLTERLPAFVEFASIASAVVGPSIASRNELGRTRERVRCIIEEAAFHPVFQPIVSLASMAVIGNEALTRFDDGTSPDEQFRQAAAVGLGLELECATLAVALRSARSLPEGLWLNVNVSPAVILAGEPLRSIIERYPGHLVLEVTEHEVITDYAAFRRAVAALGPGLQVAVDDAGAGFASLRHIVELQPHMVKVDRSLVAGVDTDPARQALLAGLRHFTDAQDCALVAEGIETRGELDALVALGIRSGQGFLLGRPARCDSSDG